MMLYELVKIYEKKNGVRFSRPWNDEIEEIISKPIRNVHEEAEIRLRNMYAFYGNLIHEIEKGPSSRD